MDIVDVRYGVLLLGLQLELCLECCLKDILLLENSIKNYPRCRAQLFEAVRILLS